MASGTGERADAQYDRPLSIVDAGFLQQAHRARFIEAARRRAAPVVIVDFHAPRVRYVVRHRTAPTFA
jgi:predicted kinase